MQARYEARQVNNKHRNRRREMQYDRLRDGVVGITVVGDGERGSGTVITWTTLSTVFLATRCHTAITRLASWVRVHGRGTSGREIGWEPSWQQVPTQYFFFSLQRVEALKRLKWKDDQGLPSAGKWEGAANDGSRFCWRQVPKVGTLGW